jgi:hypothetical protein
MTEQTYNRDLFTSQSAQDWHNEEIRRTYAYGRQDERARPVDCLVHSGDFAEAAAGVGVGDFPEIYARLAAAVESRAA